MISDEPMILYGCSSRCGKTYCMEEFRKKLVKDGKEVLIVEKDYKFKNSKGD